MRGSLVRLLPALLCGAAPAVVHAEPEGYMGGTGRPAGTAYVPPYGGPTITVVGVSLESPAADTRWECDGGEARPPGADQLVTVTLVIANREREPVITSLAHVDLVIGHPGETGVRVVEGACEPAGHVDAEIALRGRARILVREQFLVPRGATPKVLVYNDDDFPALFALPRARPRPRTLKRRRARAR